MEIAQGGRTTTEVGLTAWPLKIRRGRALFKKGQEKEG